MSALEGIDPRFLTLSLNIARTIDARLPELANRSRADRISQMQAIIVAALKEARAEGVDPFAAAVGAIDP